MPYTSISVDGSSVRSLAVNTLTIENGYLNSLGTSIQDDPGESAQSFVQVGISNGPTMPGDEVCILAQGYIGGNSQIQWSGRLPLQPDMRIFIKLWSSVGATVKLHAITEQ